MRLDLGAEYDKAEMQELEIAPQSPVPRPLPGTPTAAKLHTSTGAERGGDSSMAWPTTSRQSRGYGAAWTKLRLRILARDKHLCQPCIKATPKRIHTATHVDHIVPKAKGGTDDEINLQAIAAECHAEKTAIENGARTKVRIGVDGWPI